VNVLIRVDAGEQIGLGHFYRTLNVANKLVNRGHSVTIIHLRSPFWQNISRSFDILEITGDSEDFMLEMMRTKNFDIFYVDGIINFSDTFFRAGRNLCKFIFYQNLSESRSKCDIFILPSIHHSESFFKIFRTDTKIFVGLQYFAFNEKIERLSPRSPLAKNEMVREVAVISGGSDPSNFLKKVYDLISCNFFPEIQFIFYYGENYMHRGSLENMTKCDATVFKPYDHQAILEAQMLISAYGVSTLEFLYLGMPIISLGHQVANSNASKAVADKTSAIVHAGFIDEISAEIFNDILSTVINDQSLREELISNGKQAIDLNGINRIITILENE
jgi:spore coat polysaccharide biosynthesis predicted glycosyltransferase SpsG